MFEGIYGIDKDSDEGEAIAYGLIGKRNREWFDLEVPLMSTKWFDYRHLRPVQATYLFADRYKAAFRRFYRQNLNHRVDDTMKVFKHEDLFENKPMIVSGIWRARQTSDAIGMPYDEFLNDAFERSLRTQREYLPRPHQLYTNQIIDFVSERWEDRQRARLYIAESTFYTNQNYLGLPHQNAHHEWLFTQAEKRPNRAHWLNEFVFQRDLIPLAKFEARYCDDPTLISSTKHYA